MKSVWWTLEITGRAEKCPVMPPAKKRPTLGAREWQATADLIAAGVPQPWEAQ